MTVRTEGSRASGTDKAAKQLSGTVIRIDKELVLEVMENLLANASVYTKDKIVLTIANRGTELELRVEDNGGGFSEEALQMAGSPFYRSENKKKREHFGSHFGGHFGGHFGLGLYICKQLCEKCGGGLRIENAAGGSGGVITVRQVMDMGLHRSILQELVACGELYRYGRGLYVRSDMWEDDLYLLQYKYNRGIYSHETSLYLLGYSDRTPAQYTMTFPKGYNTPSLKDENIIMKRVIPDNYSFGIMEVKSPCGNEIRIYNLERTLCDIVRGSGSDIQIINDAMKRYAASKEKDIHRLMNYAEQLRVKPKIIRYMEILL